ncbi:hypothetical protein RchiOBHm_Chr1g0357591 [Rosa chinensis]|uniref:Uncharacterized protein n=1 Tax=Rosa chinensis TaxID=74649 RepID=A0A2P6SHX8_ROSCH|nr:hypothetical protein RchiOBHm_Chr1g0357591 [Rosa chinensis]
MNEVSEDCGIGSENGINLSSTSFCSWVGGLYSLFCLIVSCLRKALTKDAQVLHFTVFTPKAAVYWTMNLLYVMKHRDGCNADLQLQS